MYVCMYVCTYVCIYVCMYVRMYLYMYVCIMYVCIYVCMYVCTYIRTYVCKYVCMYVCTCVYVTLIYIMKGGACVCGSRNSAENKDGRMKLWQSVRVDYGTCHAKYNKKWSSRTR